ISLFGSKKLLHTATVNAICSSEIFPTSDQVSRMIFSHQVIVSSCMVLWSFLKHSFTTGNSFQVLISLGDAFIFIRGRFLNTANINFLIWVDIVPLLDRCLSNNYE